MSKKQGEIDETEKDTPAQDTPAAEEDTKPSEPVEGEPKAKESLDGFTVGRIVHYVMPNGSHRPAIIVNDWKDQMNSCEGYANLQVFTDGRNDAQYFGNQNQYNEVEGGTMWATSICFNDEDKPAGTWHWIEPA